MASTTGDPRDKASRDEDALACDAAFFEHLLRALAGEERVALDDAWLNTLLRQQIAPRPVWLVVRPDVAKRPEVRVVVDQIRAITERFDRVE